MIAFALALVSSLQTDPKELLDHLRPGRTSDTAAAFRALCDQGDQSRAELERAAGDPALRWWVDAVREEIRARRERPAAWSPKPVTLSFKNEPLGTVLRALDVKASGEQASGLISLELKDATPHEAFREALQAAGKEGYFFLSSGSRGEGSLMLTERRHEPLAAFRSRHYDAKIRGAAEVRHADFKGPPQRLLRLFGDVIVGPGFPILGAGPCVLTEVRDARGELMEIAPSPKKGSDREAALYHTMSSLQVQLEAYVRLTQGLPDRLSLVRGHATILSSGGTEKVTLAGVLQKPKQSIETTEARVTMVLDDVDPEYVLTVTVEPLRTEWKGLGLGGDSGSINLIDDIGRKFEGAGSGSQGYHTYDINVKKAAGRKPESVTVTVKSDVFERKVYFEFSNVKIQ
jgi:hypothetical protein